MTDLDLMENQPKHLKQTLCLTWFDLLFFQALFVDKTTRNQSINAIYEIHFRNKEMY